MVSQIWWFVSMTPLHEKPQGNLSMAGETLTFLVKSMAGETLTIFHGEFSIFHGHPEFFSISRAGL
jgi:hypothetical protein